LILKILEKALLVGSSVSANQEIDEIEFENFTLKLKKVKRGIAINERLSRILRLR
jgi:hypothetical protein